MIITALESKANSIFKLRLGTILDVGFWLMFWPRLSHMEGVAIYTSYDGNAYVTAPRYRYHARNKIGYGFRLVHGVPVVMN